MGVPILHPSPNFVAALRARADRSTGVGRRPGNVLAKIVSLLLLAAMIVHIIRPLGLPGLRKRGDFWKIAVAAIAVMMLAVLVRPG